jgi:hypothetical protein
MRSAKAAKVAKKETLYDVDYTITLNGFTVIAADSAEAAKAIVENRANFLTLFQGSGAFNSASATKIAVNTKVDETSDNIGAMVVDIPRVRTAVQQ